MNTVSGKSCNVSLTCINSVFSAERKTCENLAYCVVDEALIALTRKDWKVLSINDAIKEKLWTAGNLVSN